MLTSAARKMPLPEPLVIYVASSLDGTTFALDPVSQQRIRESFPNVHVSTRHIFISHDTREAFDEMIGRFEDQVATLLSGVSVDQLIKRFNRVSFRDPKSEQEVGSLPPAAKRVARRG